VERTILPEVARRAVRRLPGGDDGRVADWVAVEEPLELRVDGETVAITMRSPGDDEALALGFLFAEGIVASAADVGAIVRCGRPGTSVVDVRAAPGASLEPARLLAARRFVPITSACGVCGRAAIEDLAARCRPLAAAPLDAGMVSACLAGLRDAQPAFALTGGLHAAAAFDRDGGRLAAAEDVGRHNAVDKVVGRLLRDGRVGDRAPALLAVSGRTSFELVQKAAVAGIATVAGVGAASTLAIDLAARTGVALLAFVRDGRLCSYAGAVRVAAGVVGAGSPA
jgi:FdhD protein